MLRRLVTIALRVVLFFFLVTAVIAAFSGNLGPVEIAVMVAGSVLLVLAADRLVARLSRPTTHNI